MLCKKSLLKQIQKMLEKISTYVESSNYKSENYKTNDPEKIMPLLRQKIIKSL